MVDCYAEMLRYHRGLRRKQRAIYALDVAAKVVAGAVAYAALERMVLWLIRRR